MKSYRYSRDGNPGKPADEQAERDNGQHHQGDPAFGPFGAPTDDQESQREHDRREDEEQLAPIAVDLVVRCRPCGRRFPIRATRPPLWPCDLWRRKRQGRLLAFVQIVDLLLVVGLDFTPSGDFVDLALDGKFLGLDVVVELLDGPLRNRLRTIDAALADRVAALGKQHEDQTDGHHRPPGQERETAEIRSQVGGDFPAFRSARRGRRLRPAAVGNDERLVARRALDPLPQMGVADLESMAFRTGRFVGHSKTPRTEAVGRSMPSAISVYFIQQLPVGNVCSRATARYPGGVLVRWRPFL